MLRHVAMSLRQLTRVIQSAPLAFLSLCHTTLPCCWYRLVNQMEASQLDAITAFHQGTPAGVCLGLAREPGEGPAEGRDMVAARPRDRQGPRGSRGGCQASGVSPAKRESES